MGGDSLAEVEFKQVFAGSHLDSLTRPQVWCAMVVILLAVRRFAILGQSRPNLLTEINVLSKKGYPKHRAFQGRNIHRVPNRLTRNKNIHLGGITTAQLIIRFAGSNGIILPLLMG